MSTTWEIAVERALEKALAPVLARLDAAEARAEALDAQLRAEEAKRRTEQLDEARKRFRISIATELVGAAIVGNGIAREANVAGAFGLADELLEKGGL